MTSEPAKPASEQHPDAARPATLVVLTILLFAEAAFLIVVVVWLIVELLTVASSSVMTAVAFTIVAALGAAWVTLTAFGALGSRGWIRGSVITWQVIQIAIAVAAFQGTPRVQLVGGILMVTALAGIVLVLTPPVTRALTQRAAGGDDDGRES